MTNGYKIIDLKSPTVYEDIKANYRKPLLFTNIEIDGVEKDAVFSDILVSDNSFIFYAYNKEIIINNNNTIQYNNYSNKPIIWNNIINIKFSSNENICLYAVSLNSITSEGQILEGYKYLATGDFNGKIPLYAEVITENGEKKLNINCADGNVYSNFFSLAAFTFFNTII